MAETRLHISAILGAPVPLPEFFRRLDEIVAPLGFFHDSNKSSPRTRLEQGKGPLFTAKATLINPVEIIDWPDYDRAFPLGQVILFYYITNDLLEDPDGEQPFPLVLETWVKDEIEPNKTSRFRIVTNLFDYYSSTDWYPEALDRITSLASAIHQKFSCKRTTLYRGEHLDILESPSQIVVEFARQGR